MKLSIIVTTWGVEPWVDACRESIRAAMARTQTEVEVVEVCNGNGVAAARNEGLARTTGDYVWFVDGDDVIHPAAIERIVAAIAACPGVDIVHFKLQSGTDFTEAAVAPVRYDLTEKGVLAAAYRLHARWLLGSSAVYRRGLVTDMRFENLVKAEDSLWGRRAFYAARSLVWLPEALYGYRQRPSGANQMRDRRHYDDARRAGWLMLIEGLKVPGIRGRVIFDWLRYRLRELPKWMQQDSDAETRR